MEKLGRSTNLLEISVNKYDDLLVLDCSDVSIFSRFTNLYTNLDKISKDAAEEVDKLKKEYAGNEEDVNVNEIQDYLNVHIMVSKKIMGELDSVFGSDFSKKVFRESYEVNPDFVPDEISLAEVVELLVPIMEKAYGERIKRNKSKYSATKRGKHTKTKQELIQGYMGKSGAGE